MLQPSLKSFSTALGFSFVAIVSAALLSGGVTALLGFAAPLLIASMGAAAVLMFFAPASPMASYRAFYGGNIVAATVGVLVTTVVDNTVLAAALAVTLAIAVMQLLRCQHPPGGATALFAAIGGDAIHGLGLSYVFAPVGLNVLVMGVWVCIHRRFILARTEQQHRIHRWLRDERKPSALPPVYSEEECVQLLATFQLSHDVKPAVLQQLLFHANKLRMANALRGKTVADCIDKAVPALTYGDSLLSAWQTMLAHESRVIAVVNKADHVEGMLTLASLCQLAGQADSTFQKLDISRMNRALAPSSTTHTHKLEYVGQLAEPIESIEASQPAEVMLNRVLATDEIAHADWLAVTEQGQYRGLVATAHVFSHF